MKDKQEIRHTDGVKSRTGGIGEYEEDEVTLKLVAKSHTLHR